MENKVDKKLIHKIMMLDLKRNIICDNKKSYTMKIIDKLKDGSYLVETSLVEENISDFNKIEIELKGNIDIEYLRYRGQIELKEKSNSEGCYYMRIHELTKYNMRDYKRVPYKRSISIIEPISSEAFLMNISASGALIYIQSEDEIPEQIFKFSILLNRKILNLDAQIVDQRYDEKLGVNTVRCKFVNIDNKTRELLVAVVKQIVLQAKKRLQEK